MTTLEKILTLLTKYKTKGTFQTEKKSKLSEILIANSILSDLKNYGVYIFTEINHQNSSEEIVYIGKNGTISTNGKFGNHTLNKRIMQGKKKSKWISTGNFKVYWFVTSKKTDLIKASNIPSVVECQLLKKYFDLENKLPKHNNAF